MQQVRYCVPVVAVAATNYMNVFGAVLGRRRYSILGIGQRPNIRDVPRVFRNLRRDPGTSPAVRLYELQSVDGGLMNNGDQC
jgi:hypothetical protein